MTTTATRPRKASTKKGTKKRPTKTPEQRAAENQALTDKFNEQVKTLVTSEGWKKYLTMATRFHSYSFNNLMLIWAQYPESTQVAGYEQWKKYGRQVTAGEKSISIRGFATRAPRQDEIDAGKYKEGEKVKYFPPRRVFDIAQTHIVDEEKWAAVAGAPNYMQNLEGDDPEAMGAKLIEFLNGYGWTVAEEDLKGGLEGYADPRKKHVAYRIGTAPAEIASTLAHESAHVVDGHTDDLAEYNKHRGRMEAIAESVAYVLGQHFKIDTSQYSVAYVGKWTKGDLEMLQDVAEAVLRTVKTILEALDPQEEDTDTDE